MTASDEANSISSFDLADSGVASRDGGIELSIIAPVYCCQDWLEELYTRIRSAAGAVTDDFEVILVEDGSPDGSWAELCRLAGQDRRLKALRLSRNFGQHAAIMAGLECARGEFTVLMDSDLQDEPENIPALIEKLNQGFDIVYTVANGHAGSKLTSRLFHRQFAKTADANVPAGIGTYRAFTSKVRDAILLHRERNVIIGPLMHSFGFTAVSIDVKRAPRRAGKSSYSPWRRIRLSIAIMVIYSNTFNTIFAFLGAAIVALSLLYGCWIVLQYIIVGRILEPGITLIVLLLIVLVGIVALGFGAVGTYLHFIYQEVLQRPRYLVQDTCNTPLRVNLQDWLPPASRGADEPHNR